jgi:hypothetical protein
VARHTAAELSLEAEVLGTLKILQISYRLRQQFCEKSGLCYAIGIQMRVSRDGLAYSVAKLVV